MLNVWLLSFYTSSYIVNRCRSPLPPILPPSYLPSLTPTFAGVFPGLVTKKGMVVVNTHCRDRQILSDSNIPLMNRNFTQHLKTKVSLTFNGFLVCVYMSIGMWEGASLPHTCTPPHSHNLSAQSSHPFLAKVVCSMILSFTHSLARPPPLLLPPSLPPSYCHRPSVPVSPHMDISAGHLLLVS